MKTKTILKTVGFVIGWLLSFQLIGVVTYLMNQPSNLSFTFGALAAVTTLGAIGYFAYKFGGMSAQLLSEYKESKEVKQVNKNQKQK